MAFDAERGRLEGETGKTLLVRRGSRFYKRRGVDAR
jgi:hypothetical protein